MPNSWLLTSEQGATDEIGQQFKYAAWNPPEGDGELPGVLVDAEVQHDRFSGWGRALRLNNPRENPLRFDVGRALIDINARHGRRC